jgi:hypothetical protein
MLKAQIEPGVEYAFREHPAPGIPFQRVRIIRHARGSKWRMEWIDPSPGLVDYADSGQLIVRWKDHKAFLKEEANQKSLRMRSLDSLLNFSLLRPYCFAELAAVGCGSPK